MSSDSSCPQFVSLSFRLSLKPSTSTAKERPSGANLGVPSTLETSSWYFSWPLCKLALAAPKAVRAARMPDTCREVVNWLNLDHGIRLNAALTSEDSAQGCKSKLMSAAPGNSSNGCQQARAAIKHELKLQQASQAFRRLRFITAVQCAGSVPRDPSNCRALTDTEQHSFCSHCSKCVARKDETIRLSEDKLTELSAWTPVFHFAIPLSSSGRDVAEAGPETQLLAILCSPPMPPDRFLTCSSKPADPVLWLRFLAA